VKQCYVNITLAHAIISAKQWSLISRTIVVIKEYSNMLESLFIFMVTFSLLVGVTEEVVVPVATQAVEVTTDVIETTIDYIKPEETTGE